MAQSTEALYAKSLELSANVEDNFLELAKTLRQLLDREPEMFKKLVEKGRIGSRKAYYLVNISRWFDNAPVGRARLRNLGWTKLQLIGPHVTEHNLEELLKMAEENTSTQLKALLKGEKPLNNAHCVLLYFTPEQYDTLEETLLKNGASRSGRGMVNKEEAIINAITANKAKAHSG